MKIPSPTTAYTLLLTRQQNDASAGSAIDTQGGASGSSSSSFNLSKGGLIAICIVVALVVIFGIASTVLYILAKRRQWDVRASIRRASRRLTGRAPPPTERRDRDRQSKRAGYQMTSTPATKGHKRGLQVEVQDAEKGQGAKETSGGTWTQKLWRNDWKR